MIDYSTISLKVANPKAIQKEIFSVYCKVRATRQDMGDIVDKIRYDSASYDEFNIMYNILSNMETNLEQTLKGL